MLESINPTIKFEDTKAPFWMIEKNGYYTVGNKNYIHKTHALIEASQTRLDVHWEFGSHIFNKINWREPVNLSISALYRMRAQQLRDKYDYLILAFSGGADSSNVLDSFVLNNIHLDEILIHWPRKLTQGKYTVSADTNAFNILSEWELAVIPKLEHIKKNYPNIKITIDDLSDLSDEYSEDAITITKNKFHYLNIKRQRSMCRRSSELMNKNINVATIYGFDKPRILKVNNVLCAYFVDDMPSIVSDLADGYERNIEYFYWAIDLPELPVKQAQIMYQYFKLNANKFDDFYSKDIKTLSSDNKYPRPENSTSINDMRNITSQLLYPTWNPAIFQANKPLYVSFKCEYHAWIGSADHRFLESWSSAFSQYANLIEKKYHWSDDSYYTPLSTKLYPLGVI
jgi:hypothetical protein